MATSELPLTRRRSPHCADCWHVYVGDVRAGTLSKAVGLPNAADAWQWTCGFYPGSHPGELRGGIEPTFDQAREAFAAAWRIFVAKRTEADFEEWREARDWTARKYALIDAGHKVPIR